MFWVHLTGLCKVTSKVLRPKESKIKRKKNEIMRDMIQNEWNRKWDRNQSENETEYEAFSGTNRYFQTTAQILSHFIYYNIKMQKEKER